MLKIAAAILSIYMSLFALVGFAVYQAGVGIVHVRDKAEGTRIFVPVPVGLMSAGVNLLPDHTILRLNAKVEPHQKYIRSFAEELSKCPDGVFVEVETSDEHIVIEKRGGNLIVEVNSPDDEVYIRMPIKATSKLITNLASID